MSEMAVKLAKTREELMRAARESEETKARLLQAEARAVRIRLQSMSRVHQII